MTRRLVVIGADAAGMSAASQALRVAAKRGARPRGHRLRVDASTRRTASAGSPTGSPGTSTGADALVARTAAEHRANGIDLRLGSTVTEIDLDGRARRRAAAPAGTERVGFDELMIGTGAEPIVPDWARGVPGVLHLKTLDDGTAWRRLLAATRRPGSGAGARRRRRLHRRRGGGVVRQARRAHPAGDPQRRADGALARPGDGGAGAPRPRGAGGRGGHRCRGVRRSRTATGCSARPASAASSTGPTRWRWRSASDPGWGWPGRPDCRWASTTAWCRTTAQRVVDGVWAAGDCCEVWDRVLESHWYTPLGTHANKAGKVAGTNIGGGSARFAGSVGTAITRAGAAEVARTGVLPSWARERGWDVDAGDHRVDHRGRLHARGGPDHRAASSASAAPGGCSAARSSAGAARASGSTSWRWRCGPG